MKNEVRIVELFSEMRVKQEEFVQELKEVKQIQIRQENHLIKMLEILANDVPKFDEILDIEFIKENTQIVLKKHKQWFRSGWYLG